jgi:tetraacyldisaccharide 4'-kinase
VYGTVTATKYQLYRLGLRKAAKSGFFTISAGNLSIGGTGKTPFVLALAAELKRCGLNPLLVNKDYGGPDPNTPRLISDGQDLFHSISQLSEEAWFSAVSLLSPLGYEIHKKNQNHFLPSPIFTIRDTLSGVPVVSCKSRIKAIQHAARYVDFDVVLLDDGFQHYQLQRNVDIVLLDSINPFGGEYLIPLGTLREPIARLKRADQIIFTGAERISEDELQLISAELIERVSAKATFSFRSDSFTLTSILNREVYSKETVNNLRLFSFCGIGAPERFENSLNALYPSCLQHTSFSDHHRYTTEDLHRLLRESEQFNADWLLTTGKDAVKIPLSHPICQKLLILEPAYQLHPGIVPAIREKFAHYKRV